METDKNRVRGLDSIRFVCAMWVVFAHIGFIPILHNHIGPGNLLGDISRGVWRNLFAGPPAVVVFFLISGFCIHYPFRNRGSIPLWKYWIRRYLRIGIPALAGMLIIHFLAPASDAFNLYATNNTVVWSLVAEAVYYGLYPVLFLLNRRYGWNLLLGCSSLSAVMVMLSDPRAFYFPSYGPWLTWIIGLPSWLLGCRLAQLADGDRHLVVTSRRLWCLRLGVWFFASATSAMRFHASTGYPWTLNVFAFVCFIWLRLEVSYYRKHPPVRLFEWAGQWSYSIYIFHLAVPAGLRVLGITNFTTLTDWFVSTIAVLPACYLFYLLIEAPSHWLARAIAGSLRSSHHQGRHSIEASFTEALPQPGPQPASGVVVVVD